MKKATLVIASLILTVLFISSTFATVSLEKRLYKDTILSSNYIKTEYSDGSVLVKKISDAFMKFRLNRDKVSAKRFQDLVKPKIVALNNKSFLNRNDRKLLKLYKNIYYRTVLLLDYQLKY